MQILEYGPIDSTLQMYASHWRLWQFSTKSQVLMQLRPEDVTIVLGKRFAPLNLMATESTRCPAIIILSIWHTHSLILAAATAADSWWLVGKSPAKGKKAPISSIEKTNIHTFSFSYVLTNKSPISVANFLELLMHPPAGGPKSFANFSSNLSTISSRKDAILSSCCDVMKSRLYKRGDWQSKKHTKIKYFFVYHDTCLLRSCHRKWAGIGLPIYVPLSCFVFTFDTLSFFMQLAYTAFLIKNLVHGVVRKVS